MPETATPLYRLADLQTGGIAKFVADRRGNKSWREVSADLFLATGLDVSYETLRSWFPEESS